jgi:hypothetical protein
MAMTRVIMTTTEREKEERKQNRKPCIEYIKPFNQLSHNCKMAMERSIKLQSLGRAISDPILQYPTDHHLERSKTLPTWMAKTQQNGKRITKNDHGEKCGDRHIVI